MSKGNGRIRLQLWIKLFGSTKYRGFCHWCNKILTFEESTYDHVPALAEGNRKSGPGVISCKRCNLKRGIKTSRKIRRIKLYERKRDEILSFLKLENLFKTWGLK